MGIAHHIREIGRGRDGARALPRADAADLFGQVLDGRASDLEVGAFCLAMRMKGETGQELAGFLDATLERVARLPDPGRPVIVLPSYNGARKLPALTPLLALLLARAGHPVLIHGMASETRRVYTAEVLALLGIQPRPAVGDVGPATVAYLPTATLHPGLQRLIEVRRVVGLRNSAHSVVKLLAPCAGPSVVLASFTHPEYARTMAEAFTLMRARAMLMRGTEGEPVADPRRMPRVLGFRDGEQLLLEPGQSGSLGALPELPRDCGAAETARYIRAVLDGTLPVPGPIARQVELVARLADG